jgi:hypothetical protein
MNTKEALFKAHLQAVLCEALKNKTQVLQVFLKGAIHQAITCL